MVTEIAELPDVAFDLLLRCRSPLSRSQVSVDFSSAHDRQPHPDGRREEAIDDIWKQRLASQPSLYNGTKFRYGGYRVVHDEQSLNNMKVCFCVGLTDYRTFVGTNLCSEWEQFLAPSTDDVDRCKYTSSPLGNAAVVETTDHQILILQRSADVGEFPGHLAFPGGHSEPMEVGIESHTKTAATSREELNVQIVKEMFDGITREVVEETGVPASFLSDPVFMGFTRRKVNVRPAAFFYVKCALTATEVLLEYRYAEHAFESTVLLTISANDLVEAAKRMPGCHQGGVALYLLMREACSSSN